MAPVFCLMENYLIQEINRRYLQWPKIDGLFTPGGSFANLYGLLCSRFHKFPNTKDYGIKDLPQMVVFTSERSHYSIEKGAIMMGIGRKNVVNVPADRKGLMIPSELERLIKERIEMGHTPVMVNATIGTTVFGAIDPLDDIKPICDKYGIWLHADCALGGGTMFAPSKAELVKGLKTVDSIT